MKKCVAALCCLLASIALPALAITPYEKAINDPRSVKIGKCAVAASFTGRYDLSLHYRKQLDLLLDEFSLSPGERSKVSGHLIGRSAGRFSANPALFEATDKNTAAAQYIEVHCHRGRAFS